MFWIPLALVVGFYLGLLMGRLCAAIKGGDMCVEINSENDQQNVNQLRIDLAQTMIDMTEVFVHDANSRVKKDKAIEGLRRIGQRMDNLGIKHAAMLRCHNVG